MDESAEAAGSDGLTRARVAQGALRQAARHERALRACLAELNGRGAPSGALTLTVVRRARRHADRAFGLAKMAARLNRDPLVAAPLAAALERHERDVMRVARWDRADTMTAEVA